MPIASFTTDAIYLGDYAPLTGGVSVRNLVSGSYTTDNTDPGRLATIEQLTLTGNSNGFETYINTNTPGQGGTEPGGTLQNSIYSDTNVFVQFTRANGTTFTANMIVFQLADGSVYMVPDIQESPASPISFQYHSNSGQVESFVVPSNLDPTSGGFGTYPGNWSGSAFPPPPPPCFTTGTMILTDRGEVAVETLRQGDLVMTMDHGLQPVRWIGTKTLSARQLSSDDKLRPIRIKAGALGNGLPQTDLTVSPQHRMLVRSNIAQRMFGQNEVLVAAKQLVLLDGIDVLRDATAVTYVHFLCNQHEVVFANGAPTESLYTGPQALKSVPAAARAEILAVFPELSDVDYTTLSARTLVKGRQGRQLAVRHKNNAKPLLTAH